MSDAHSPELIERFWNYVDKSGGPHLCWIWTGPIQHGYGHLSFGRRFKWKAHRLSYSLANPGEQLPECVCHKCDNPRCVNPSHLFPGTRTINNLDCKLKGRLKPPVQQLGERNSNAKLSNADVSEIIRLVESGKKYRELTGQFRTTKSNISQIVNGKRRVAG